MRQHSGYITGNHAPIKNKVLESLHNPIAERGPIGFADGGEPTGLVPKGAGEDSSTIKPE